METEQPGQSAAPETQPWEGDPRFKGKGAQDVWQSYTELQSKLGDYDTLKKQTQELDTLKPQLAAYQDALQRWEQYRAPLEKIGWDPTKLSSQPDAGSPDVLGQWASKYSSLVPEEQFAFLIKDVIAPLYQAATGQFERRIKGMIDESFTTYQGYASKKDQLWMSMLKAQFPDKDWQGLYQNAYKMAEEWAKGGYDPFQAHLDSQIATQKQEEVVKKAVEQARADWQREQEQRQQRSVSGPSRVSSPGGVQPKNATERREMAARAIADRVSDIRR